MNYAPPNAPNPSLHTLPSTAASKSFFLFSTQTLCNASIFPPSTLTVSGSKSTPATTTLLKTIFIPLLIPTPIPFTADVAPRSLPQPRSAWLHPHHPHPPQSPPRE